MIYRQKTTWNLASNAASQQTQIIMDVEDRIANGGLICIYINTYIGIMNVILPETFNIKKHIFNVWYGISDVDFTSLYNIMSSQMFNTSTISAVGRVPDS